VLAVLRDAFNHLSRSTKWKHRSRGEICKQAWLVVRRKQARNDRNHHLFFPNDLTSIQEGEDTRELMQNYDNIERFISLPRMGFVLDEDLKTVPRA
jgi:hypothetical protein